MYIKLITQAACNTQYS